MAGKNVAVLNQTKIQCFDCGKAGQDRFQSCMSQSHITALNVSMDYAHLYQPTRVERHTTLSSFGNNASKRSRKQFFDGFIETAKDCGCLQQNTTADRRGSCIMVYADNEFCPYSGPEDAFTLSVTKVWVCATRDLHYPNCIRANQSWAVMGGCGFLGGAGRLLVWLEGMRSISLEQEDAGRMPTLSFVIRSLNLCIQ